MHDNDNDENEYFIKPNLHEGVWDVKFAEIHLKGDSLISTYYPLVSSLLEHIGQNAVLSARSAMVAGDNKEGKQLIALGKLMSALACTIKMVKDNGFTKTGEILGEITEGDRPDPAKKLFQSWTNTVGNIPTQDLGMMDKKVLVALRMSEEGDFVKMTWDETICGKNVSNHEGVDAEIAKREKQMGIHNTCPSFDDKGNDEIEGVDEDGVRTTINTSGDGFKQVMKTKDDDSIAEAEAKATKGKKPKSEKDKLNAMLDSMLKQMEEAKAKAKQDSKDSPWRKKGEHEDKPKPKDEDEPPLPPSRFN